VVLGGTYPVGLVGFGGDDCYDVDGHCGYCIGFSVRFVYMQYMESSMIIQKRGCESSPLFHGWLEPKDAEAR
jgi:hypothetical protein